VDAIKLVRVRADAHGAFAADGDVSASFGRRISLPDGGVDGIFASWHWVDGQLSLATDRYGVYPLFYARTDDGLLLASHVQALLERGVSAELDFDALAVFLRVGFFVGSDTPFRAIRAVPPDAVVRFDQGQLRIEGRRPEIAPEPVSRAIAVDAFIALFRQAIRRRLPSQAFQLPLSGGRDSRHILLALIEAEHAPAACVTTAHFPPRGNADIAVAAALCRRLGVRHVALAQYSRTDAEHEKNRRTHLLSDEHAQFVVVGDYLRGVTRETYDGIAGDVLSQSGYLNPEAHACFSAGGRRAAEYLLDRYPSMVSEKALHRLLAPGLMRLVTRDRAIARLVPELATHMAAANPVSSFFFWNRTRREIALGPYGVMQGLTVYAPYLDRDVFALLASLPAALVMDRRLHSDVIARAYPHVADIPYAVSDRVHDSAALRRLAVALMATTLGTPRMLRRRTTLPRLAVTAITGDPSGLWHAALTFYLGQLADVAAARAR
jgi:asparagine synthase (glutamine-hydrolysing)